MEKIDLSSDINDIRSFVMGMLEAGSTQRKVALNLDFDVSTIRRWWAKYQRGEIYIMERVLDVQKSSQELPKLLSPNPCKNYTNLYVDYLKD